MLLIAFLVLCAAASVSAAARVECDSTSERALVAGMLFLGVICIPVHVLGWCEVLTRDRFLLAAGLLALLMLALPWVAARTRREAFERTRAVVLLPWTTVLEMAREKSVALVGVLACTGIFAWTTWLAYLAPSSSWDGLMYHEGIVGFAIQNQGFQWVTVPQGVLEQINGFPRTCEYLPIATALLDGKRFMDFVPTLTSPIAILAFYVWMRRFTQRRSVAVGLATGLFLVPAFVLELRSTYVDIGYAVCFAASCHFVTRTRLTVAMAWIGALSIGLLFGMKVTGMLLAPPLLLIWGVRILGQAMTHRRAAYVSTALLGAASVVALGALTYLRNWLLRHNVVWPSDLHIEALNVHWQGPWPISNMQHSAADVWRDLFDLPKFDEQFADSRDNGYGNVAPFLIFPLSIIALGMLALRNAKHLLRIRTHGRTTPAADFLLLLIAGLTLVAFVQSPAYWWARLNLHIIVVAFVLSAWLIGAGRLRIVGEVLSFALIAVGMLTLIWSTPRWDVDLDGMNTLLHKSPRERIAHPMNHLVMPRETAIAREAELGHGDVVAFTHHPFIGTLWNESYSNEVVHVPYRGERAFLADLEAHRAKWVVVQSGGSELYALARHADEWQRIGFATEMNNESIAFRRVHRSP